MEKVFIPELSLDGFACDEAPEEFHTVEALAAQGIGFNAKALTDVMDESPMATDPGINAPWFYLNYMAKKPIQVVTQRTTMDEILGRTQEGSWAHNTITKQFREFSGRTAEYKDFADATAPRVNRGYSRDTRTIIRLSAGLIVGELESRQSALVPGMYSPHQDKRESLALLMKLDRDAIGYFGYQVGDARCFGLLNDPRLDPFYQVPAAKDASGGTTGTVTKWQDKSAHDIIRDLQFAMSKVMVRARGNFIPATTPFKLVIPVGCDQYLNKITECGGYSVRKWIADNWKACTIVNSPVFDGALGGENVFYIIASKFGTGPTAEQIVPSSLFMVGSMKRETGHSELWSMATLGTFVLQPMGIGRFFGI